MQNPRVCRAEVEVAAAEEEEEKEEEEPIRTPSGWSSQNGDVEGEGACISPEQELDSVSDHEQRGGGESFDQTGGKAGRSEAGSTTESGRSRGGRMLAR